MKAFDSIIHLWLNVEDEMKKNGMALKACPRVNVRSIMEIFAPWLFVACEYDDDVGVSMSVLNANGSNGSANSTESDNLSNIVQNHNRHSVRGDGYCYNFFSASRAHRSTRSAAASEAAAALRKNKSLGQSRMNSVREGGGIKTTNSFGKSKYGKGRALAYASLCRVLSTTCGQQLPLSVLARCCGLLYDGLSMHEPVENHLALSQTVIAGSSTRENGAG